MAFGLVFLLIVTSIDVSQAAQCGTFCPPPWVTFEEHCYRWVNIAIKWKDAERYCHTLSHPGKMARLVSIHSKEEDNFIAEYIHNASGLSVTPGYWIGFNDIGREGVFKWTDDSVADYINWAEEEPNNDGEGEDCVERFSYLPKWNDGSCNAKLGFVCKK